MTPDPLDPPISPISQPGDRTPLTPEQNRKMEAITGALELLNAAEVPFTFFASPDSPSADMKVIQGQRLSYASAKDLPLVQLETTKARQALHWSALKQFSLGFMGGIALYDVDGQPVVIFQQGQVTGVQKQGKKEPQVTA